MDVINGKQYPLWSQFVENSSRWVGGTLQDFGDSFISGNVCTKITGVSLTPNGEKSAFFAVDGEDFGCGFDVEHGGIIGGEDGWIAFSGYGGHRWRISPHKEEKR